MALYCTIAIFLCYWNEGWDALFSGDGPKALMPGGEVAVKVDDMPKVKELVGRIVGEAGKNTGYAGEIYYQVDTGQ